MIVIGGVAVGVALLQVIVMIIFHLRTLQHQPKVVFMDVDNTNNVYTEFWLAGVIMGSSRAYI